MMPANKPLKFIVDNSSFTLSREDIDRHPGSLLHSLAEAAAESDAADGVVHLHSSSSSSSSSTSAQNGSPTPSSPLLTLPGALEVTTALYRSKDGKLSVDTLSRLLAQYDSPGAAYATLDALIDFLLLPGPVSRWLPPAGRIPLQHIRVADLRMYPAAQEIAGCVLGALPFASKPIDFSPGDGACAVASQQRCAYFFLSTMRCDNDQPLTLSASGWQVYQLTEPFKRSKYEPAVMIIDESAPTDLLASCVGGRVTGVGNAHRQSVTLGQIAQHWRFVKVKDPTHNRRVAVQLASLGERTMLGGCVMAELRAALKQAAGFKVTCVSELTPTERELIDIWEVSW